MKELIIYLAGFGLGIGFTLSYASKNPPARDYQIELVGSTLKLYDGARYVGACSYYNTELEKLIINDNQ